MDDNRQDPDKPESATEDTPYVVSVGSLLSRALSTSDFIDALETAPDAEREKALRQLRQSRQWHEERLYRLEQERDRLIAQHPWLADEGE